MPFKSKAQWRALGAKMDRGEISKSTFDEFAHSTAGGYDNLPERKTQTKKPAVKPAAGPARSKGTAPAPAGKVRKMSLGSTGSRSGSRGRGRR